MDSSPSPTLRAARLPWPLPAVLAWLAAWGVYTAVAHAGGPVALGWGAAAALSLGAAWSVAGRWRQLLVAAGFPLSSGALGVAVPTSAWLAAAALLLLLYPLRAWRDAPLFPTPPDALRGLADALPLPDGAQVLDAGCGLGHGLQALRLAWPRAQLHGIEWSWPIAAACALRCRDARVRRGDLWQVDWTPFHVVYLFQRPESMARAWDKACRELAPGAWLVSLEFAVPGVPPARQLDAGGGRPLWLYRTPTSSTSERRRR